MSLASALSNHCRRPSSIGEGARFLNRQLSNRLFGKTGGLSQLFDFLSLLQYKARTPLIPHGSATLVAACLSSEELRSRICLHCERRCIARLWSGLPSGRKEAY